MALPCHCFFPSSSVPPSHRLSRYHRSFKHHHFLCCHARQRPSVSTSLPSSTSDRLTTPIFLPVLQREDAVAQNSVSVEERQNDDLIDDSILRFFKTRSSTQDPGRQGKVSFQKKRRSSWHLAEGFDSLEESESGDEDGFQVDGEVGLDHSCSNAPLNGDSGEILQMARNLPPNSALGQTLEFSPLNGVSGEIMQMARNLPPNSTLGETLEFFEGSIGALECSKLLDVMGQEGLVMACLQFFEWMRGHEHSLVTPRACSILFPILGRAGMGDELMVLFKNLPPVKEFRNVHVFNAAISGLLCCGRYSDALYLYTTMKASNVLPDHVTCSIMITVMRKNGESAKDAWNFFQKMNRRGVKWSLEALGALMKSFCVEGLVTEALVILREMEKRCILANAIVYNTIMDAYGKSNRVEDAEGLFSEMKSKGISPTTATYNILMDAYSRRIQPEIVEKLLQEMWMEGLKPDVKSYTCLVSAYGRQRKASERAADAFLRMKRAGIKPTARSYTALIHAYSVGGWHQKAHLAFENMRRERVKPGLETYTALLDAFRRGGDVRMLMQTWRSMLQEGIEGTRVTFNIIVDGLAKRGCYAEARDVISEFGKIGLRPTVMTYNMLLNAYARGGQALRLPRLLKEMAALGLEPNSCTYSTVVYAFLRVRDFKMAFLYHGEMVKSGQVPDAEAYQKLREILDVKAAKKNKKDKRAMLGRVNRAVGLVKLMSKGKDEFWKSRKTRARDRTC